MDFFFALVNCIEDPVDNESLMVSHGESNYYNFVQSMEWGQSTDEIYIGSFPWWFLN